MRMQKSATPPGLAPDPLAEMDRRFMVYMAERQRHPRDDMMTELALSRFTHYALYLLVFVMTVLGWAAANYRGWTVMLLGVVPLPPLAAKGTPWAHQAGDIHNKLVWVLLALIALHVAGALYHLLVRKDRVMQRMLSVS